MKVKDILKNLNVIFLIIIAFIALMCGLFLELLLGVWNVPRGIGIGMSILLFIIGLVGEIRNIISNEQYKKDYLNFSKQASNSMSQVLEFISILQGKVEISLKDFLHNYPNLYQKFRSPIDVVIDTEIIKVLDQLSKEDSRIGEPVLELQKIPSGMIWVIKKADLSVYGKIAMYFDKAANSSPKGYIYSINTILPSEFNNDPHYFIRDHIEEANKLADKKFSSGNPRLLRLQLLRFNKNSELDFKTPINTEQEFITDLRKINNYSECNFKRYSEKNYYALNVDDTIIRKHIKKLGANYFEESPLFLGEYILYSDTVVVKWDKACQVLYLIFGTDIVKDYKKIFELFLDSWENKSCDITRLITTKITENVKPTSS